MKTLGHCLIIGEVAQAHDGSLGTAHAYIDAIAGAGADAVKFQTHSAAAESSPSEPWRVKFSRQDPSRYDYWRRMEFSEEQWRGLKAHAEERNLLFLSSPFSLEAVELLERLGVKAWKLASGELSNRPLLERILATGKPVMLSSGMSPLAELDQVVEQVKAAGVELTVLQCSSIYPTPPEKLGLNILASLRDRYRCPVGLSDHSGTIYAGLAAAVLGASAVEVHVAFSREVFGPDVVASITTAELRQLVDGVRFIQRAQCAPVDKDQLADELGPIRALFMKSVTVLQDLPAGTVLAAAHLGLRKPGTGLPASHLNNLLGHRLVRSVRAGEQLNLNDIHGT